MLVALFPVQSCPSFLGCLEGLDHNGHEWSVLVPTELAPGRASSSLYPRRGWDESEEIHQYKRQKSGCQGDGNPQISG